MDDLLEKICDTSKLLLFIQLDASPWLQIFHQRWDFPSFGWWLGLSSIIYNFSIVYLVIIRNCLGSSAKIILNINNNECCFFLMFDYLRILLLLMEYLLKNSLLPQRTCRSCICKILITGWRETDLSNKGVLIGDSILSFWNIFYKIVSYQN